ncbi:MAG: 1-acyl-sn-glycerol-3-phosphate acyltransferase [Cyanobacteria bacterium J069]|nr:MAG: 1-acyl-sn-glycerol-3-phosphate acyltransferase [Cyanobacteria bacterium J069]
MMQFALPVLFRLRLKPWLPVGISRVKVVNAERLALLYHKFQLGQVRFILAFRHPEVDDPFSMLYLLSKAVPQAARQHHIKLRSPVHSHFVYDRGMTIWAGDWLGWLFSRLGGIPIHRGKRLDRTGIRVARELLLNGQFPLAIAPEGATNGHSEAVSPLEPGVAQLGFWCAEDLHKKGRAEQVYIVPIGIRYRYPRPIWSQIDRLLSRLEQETGLLPLAQAKGLTNESLTNEGLTNESLIKDLRYQRVLRLADHLLSEMEGFYRRFYPQFLKPELDSDRKPDESGNQRLMGRLNALLEAALGAAEVHFQLDAEGTIIDRCRRLEEAGWNAMYREDLSATFEALPPFQRGLANWGAEEAEIRLRHMRLVESFVAVTADYLQTQPTAERFAETALLMFDLVARIKGDDMPARPRLGWRHSHITVGEPICVSDRHAVYQQNHTAAKQAVAELTQDLQIALNRMAAQELS